MQHKGACQDYYQKGKLFSFFGEYCEGANRTDYETEGANNNSNDKESCMEKFKKIFQYDNMAGNNSQSV